MLPSCFATARQVEVDVLALQECHRQCGVPGASDIEGLNAVEVVVPRADLSRTALNGLHQQALIHLFRAEIIHFNLSYLPPPPEPRPQQTDKGDNIKFIAHPPAKNLIIILVFVRLLGLGLGEGQSPRMTIEIISLSWAPELVKILTSNFGNSVTCLAMFTHGHRDT